MPVSNVTQDTGCKRTEKKNSKPLTRFPGSKFSFRLNLDEKLYIIEIWCLNLTIRAKTYYPLTPNFLKLISLSF